MYIVESASRYLHWGWVQISVANLIVIAVMVVVFIGAVLFRMPAEHGPARPEERRHDDD